MKYTNGMILKYQFVAIVLYMTTLYGASSFVLLTANVEDLKRIAHKFVSESLADKIARFIVDAADKDISDHSDCSNETSVGNDGTNFDDLFKVFSKTKLVSNDTKGGVKRDRKLNNIQIRGNKNGRMKLNGNKRFKKDQRWKPYEMNNEQSSVTKKDEKRKPYDMRNEQSSLEYYRADNHSKVNQNIIIDVEKIQDSDESVKNSRKEFERINQNIKANESKNAVNIDSIPPKNEKLDVNSDIDDYYNVIDGIERTNLTTAVQRVEFDQYFNPHYTRPKVLATSGPVELAKRSRPSTNEDTSSEYD